jgi:hypothetical protein
MLRKKEVVDADAEKDSEGNTDGATRKDEVPEVCAGGPPERGARARCEWVTEELGRSRTLREERNGEASASESRRASGKSECRSRSEEAGEPSATRARTSLARLSPRLSPRLSQGSRKALTRVVANEYPGTRDARARPWSNQRTEREAKRAAARRVAR